MSQISDFWKRDFSISVLTTPHMHDLRLTNFPFDHYLKSTHKTLIIAYTKSFWSTENEKERKAISLKAHSSSEWEVYKYLWKRILHKQVFLWHSIIKIALRYHYFLSISPLTVSAGLNMFFLNVLLQDKKHYCYGLFVLNVYCPAGFISVHRGAMYNLLPLICFISWKE